MVMISDVITESTEQSDTDVPQPDPNVISVVSALEPSSSFFTAVGYRTSSREGGTQSSERMSSHPTFTRRRKFSVDEDIPVHVQTDTGFIYVTQVFTDPIMWSTSMSNEAALLQSLDIEPVVKDPQAAKEPSSDGTELARHCICHTDVNQTEEEKLQFTEELVANLTIDVKNTSANRRKYKSAEDPRPSARNIGGFGAVILGLVFGGLVLSDVPTFVRFVYSLVNKLRNKVQKINIPPPANESLK